MFSGSRPHPAAKLPGGVLPRWPSACNTPSWALGPLQIDRQPDNADAFSETAPLPQLLAVDQFQEITDRHIAYSEYILNSGYGTG